jgi:hypothetical protein
MAKRKTDKTFLDWIKRHAPELLDGEVDFDTVVMHILRADPDRMEVGPKRQRRLTQKAIRPKESKHDRTRR